MPRVCLCVFFFSQRKGFKHQKIQQTQLIVFIYIYITYVPNMSKYISKQGEEKNQKTRHTALRSPSPSFRKLRSPVVHAARGASEAYALDVAVSAVGRRRRMCSLWSLGPWFSGLLCEEQLLCQKVPDLLTFQTVTRSTVAIASFLYRFWSQEIEVLRITRR